MSEIGGYIEFEHYNKPMLHEGDQFLKFNSGRACLSQLIKSRNIRRIALPYFLCETVRETCEKHDIDVTYYHIHPDFTPDYLQDDESRFVYIVNFYGQLTQSKIQELCAGYKYKVIVDNAQAYFCKPIDHIDTIYTCRKFFGVADGAILFTDCVDANEMYRALERDKSSDRIGFLLGRFEGEASDFYRDYVRNNERFRKDGIRRMSLLTENILRSIDYENVRDRRGENYNILNKRLGSINELKPRDISGPFAYPLLILNGAGVKKKLIEKKIYVPTLWPNVLEDVNTDSIEYRYTADLLPLPVDQRYGIEEMYTVADAVFEAIS